MKKTKSTIQKKGIFELVEYDEKDNIKNEEKVQQIIKIEKRHFKKGEFFMMKKEFLMNLILKSNYNFLEIKVLAYMLKHLDFNNRIETFKQKDIAEEINSTQPRVSKAIKKLEEDRIIKKIGNDYYLNENLIKGAGDK